jgi:hypothetical protein
MASLRTAAIDVFYEKPVNEIRKQNRAWRYERYGMSRLSILTESMILKLKNQFRFKKITLT